MKRLRIGIDIDEVIADFVPAVLNFHNEKYGTSFDREHVKEYRFETVWGGTHEEKVKKLFDFYATHHFDGIAPFPGAVTGVKEIAKNHDLIVVTARDASLQRKTSAWLERHFPKTFSHVGFAHRGTHWVMKSDVCKEHAVDVLIEDQPKYAADCIKNGITVILMDHPWNQVELPKEVIRVKSWSEIPGVVEKLSQR